MPTSEPIPNPLSPPITIAATTMSPAVAASAPDVIGLFGDVEVAALQSGFRLDGPAVGGA